MTAVVDDAPHVWVVDASPMGRRLIARVLGERGYRVREYQNVSDTLRDARRMPVDCVVTTQQQQGLSGLDLAEALADRFGPGEVPVIVLSNAADAALTARAARLGIVAWLRPPVPPQILCQLVDGTVTR